MGSSDVAKYSKNFTIVLVKIFLAKNFTSKSERDKFNTLHIRCLQSIQKTLLLLVKIFLAKTLPVKETNLIKYIMYTNQWTDRRKRNDFLARKCIY